VKDVMDLPQIAGIGGEYFLLGFFLFIAFYIIVRLFAERHEHVEKKEGIKEGKPNVRDQHKKRE
jgi:hypothetical protein